MRLGEFRDMVTVEKDVSNAGDPVPDYSGTLYKLVPCNITVISGDESWRGRQLEAHVSHVVAMHDMPGITAKHRLRVVAGYIVDAILNVLYVRPIKFDGRIQYQELYCREMAGVS